MKLKKLFLFALISLTLFSCSSCKSANSDVDIKMGEMLAGGTIPSAAKIYPIFNENLSMSLNDAQQSLSSNDIWTLTHYVDVWASVNDTRGDGFLRDEAATFINEARLKQLDDNMNTYHFDYKVDAVQILTMKVEEDGRVQIPYVVKLTGTTPDDNTEKTYESVNALRFKKVNGNWYEDGVSFVLMAEAGTIEYYKDDITGEYSLNPLGDYITEQEVTI